MGEPYDGPTPEQTDLVADMKRHNELVTKAMVVIMCGGMWPEAWRQLGSSYLVIGQRCLRQADIDTDTDQVT